MFSLSAEFPNDNPLLHRGVRWVCLEPTGCPIAEHPEPEIEPPVPRLAAAVEDIVRAVDGLLAAASEAPLRSPIVALAPLMTTPLAEPPTHVEAASEISFEIEASSVEATDVVETAPEPRPSGIVLKEPLPELLREDDAIVVEELEPIAIVSVEGLGEPTIAVVEGRSNETELPEAPDDPFTILVCTLTDVAIATGSPHLASLLPALLHEGKLDPTGLPDGAARALREATVIDEEGVTEVFRGTTNAWKALLRGTSDDFMACGGSMLDEWASELLARLSGSIEKAAAMRRELRSRGVAAFGLAA